MKMLKQLLILLPALFTMPFVKAQTADEIITKHVQAVGGADKLASVNSVQMDLTMSIMGGESQATSTVLNGKGFRYESDFNGQKIVQVITDQNGWAINPMGSGGPEAMPDAQYKSGCDQIYVFPLFKYSEHGAKVELAGKEKVNNADAFKLVYTSKDGFATTYYIDAGTYYIVQIIRQGDMMGSTVDIITTLSDHKANENGIIMPGSIETNFGGNFSMTAKVNKTEFNLPVDTAIFEMK